MRGMQVFVFRRAYCGSPFRAGRASLDDNYESPLRVWHFPLLFVIVFLCHLRKCQLHAH